MTANVVRLMGPGDIRAALSLYNELFPRTDKQSQWWTWWYEENPAGPSIQMMAQGAAGEFEGMLAMTPVRLIAYGEEITVAMDSLGIIHPSRQRSGVFGALVRALHAMEAERFPLQFCFCNEKSKNAYVKHVGSEYKGPGAFYVKSPEYFPSPGSELVRVGTVNSYHGILWDRIKDRLHIGQIRDLDYLSWRYGHSPDADEYHIVNVLRNGAFFGYLILKEFDGKIDLLDYCLQKGEGLGDLETVLTLLEVYAVQTGKQYASFWALDCHAETVKVLLRRGYVRDTRAFCLLSRAFQESAVGRLDDFSQWVYTAGDMELF